MLRPLLSDEQHFSLFTFFFFVKIIFIDFQKEWSFLPLWYCSQKSVEVSMMGQEQEHDDDDEYDEDNVDDDIELV